LPGGAKGT